MTKRLAALILSVVAGAVFASAAGATKPVRGPAPPLGPFTFPAGVVCPFPVLAEVAEDRQVETIFSNGKVQYTGFFASRVTNLANGKGVTLVTPGPVRLTPEGDLLRLTTSGPLLFFFFPGDAGPGDTSTGRIYLFNGHTSTLLDPATFAFLSFSSTGRATDICALLA